MDNLKSNQKINLLDELKYGLYKYVWHDKVIYIGKSDRATVGSGILQRIKDHSRETKFQPYLKDSVIYYISMNDCIDEIGANETLLIKQFVPILNVTDKPMRPSKHNYEETLLKDRKWKLFDEDQFNAIENASKKQSEEIKQKHKTAKRKKKNQKYGNYKMHIKAF